MPLVTSKEMLQKAYIGGYAVGAFNINNLEMLQGIVSAAFEERAPLILQMTKNALEYARLPYIKKLAEAAIEESGLPICLHLDHGDSFQSCKNAIDAGFTSVMIDASQHALNENIEITKRVVDYAHDRDVVVEGELGELMGIDRTDSFYTDPDEAYTFVTKTGVDSLAVAIGTSHGAYKFKGVPNLRFDIIEAIQDLLPNLPLVLHGGSSILPEYLKTIEIFNGTMSGAKGVPEDMLRRAVKTAVCKVNIDSDLRLAFTAAMRKHLSENPAHFDPRQYLSPAREAVKACVSHKLVDVLGCNGKC